MRGVTRAHDRDLWRRELPVFAGLLAVVLLAVLL